MADKIVIFDGKTVYAWFHGGKLVNTSEQQKESGLAGGFQLSIEIDQLNEMQSETHSEFGFIPDITVEFDKMTEGEKEISKLYIESMSNVIERNGKKFATLSQIHLFQNGETKIKFKGHGIFKGKKQYKVVPFDYTNKKDIPKIMVQSTLSSRTHGWLTKMANVNTPLRAIQEFLSCRFKDHTKEEQIHISENEKIYEFAVGPDGKLWIIDHPLKLKLL